MTKLTRRFFNTRKSLNQFVLENQRDPASIQLLAVSKTRPAIELLSLYRLGQRDFGENYLQEALEKQKQLAHCSIRWHFIGPVQSNKTRALAEHFDWIHTIDRAKIAQRLSKQRPEHLPPLNLCIQINVDQEASKSGISPEQLPELVETIRQLPNVRLRGLMCIPKNRSSVEEQRKPFEQIRRLQDQINASHALQMDTLSMGMSQDIEAAIQSGSTLVRVGTAIFGPRA